jgi:isopenicillin N synthase-like dioxygenase
VDFGKFLTGDDGGKKDVAQQLDSAFRDVGFVYLRNHGVKQELVDECFEWVSGSSPIFSYVRPMILLCSMLSSA